ncbi:MAG: EAL domain-containing protein [Rhodococcus sp. (in: high G+C Gram-positive bacteria)]
MHRTAHRRQTDSARSYVDLSVAESMLTTLTSLAATTLGFSYSMVNILDEDTQYTLAQYGDGGVDTRPRDTAACAFVVDIEQTLVVPDSSAGRFSSDPVHASISHALHKLSFGAYVAVPLRGREGLVVGTLCLVDPEPHPIDDYTVQTLTSFASVVETELDVQRGTGRTALPPRNRVISDAISGGEIVAWFQPIVDLETGVVTALEALARWHRPVVDADGTIMGETVVAPGGFMPSIEGCDLEIDLDHAILTSALASFESWMEDFPALDLHVNLSARHLLSPRDANFLADVVADSSVPASRVVFEVTETRSYGDPVRANEFLLGLRALGFRVLLDDIGIGWSSLERLVEFPVDGFKIDAAIARSLGSATGDSLVRALVGFAADTGRTLVIEGIETDEQVESSRADGCTSVQGFLYSRPVPAREVLALLG